MKVNKSLGNPSARLNSYFLLKTILLNDFKVSNIARILILVLLAGMLIATFFIICDFHESYNFFKKEYYKLLHDYCLWKYPFHTQ